MMGKVEEQYLRQDWNARSAAKGWVVQKLSRVGWELALMIRATEIPIRIILGSSRTRSPHHTLAEKRDCDTNGIGRRSKEAATLLYALAHELTRLASQGTWASRVQIPVIGLRVPADPDTAFPLPKAVTLPGHSQGAWDSRVQTVVRFRRLHNADKSKETETLTMFLVANEEFQHILCVLNTNVDGKQKIMFALIPCNSTKVFGENYCQYIRGIIHIYIQLRVLNQEDIIPKNQPTRKEPT